MSSRYNIKTLSTHQQEKLQIDLAEAKSTELMGVLQVFHHDCDHFLALQVSLVPLAAE
jgi:hypothetical protein